MDSVWSPSPPGTAHWLLKLPEDMSGQNLGPLLVSPGFRRISPKGIKGFHGGNAKSSTQRPGFNLAQHLAGGIWAGEIPSVSL